MNTTVKLQPLYSYSWQVLLILFSLVLLPLIIYCVIKLIKLLSGKSAKKKTKAGKKIKKATNLVKLKEEYLSKVNDVENKKNNNSINARQAFIELSFLVREFVQLATGVNTSNLTLGEIKELSMPSLTELIEEFYRPEFDTEEESVQFLENHNPFADARKVVTEWN